MLGVGHLGQRWSGQFKIDYGIIRSETDPDKVLSALINHVRYDLNSQEKQLALECLSRSRTNCSADIRLSECFNSSFELKAFWAAIDRDIFNIVGKHTKAWRVIYGLYAVDPENIDGLPLCETGVTEKPIAAVVARLEKSNSSILKNRIGTYMERVIFQRLELFIVELECLYGDLDDCGFMKDAWLEVARVQGADTIRKPLFGYDFVQRLWPWFNQGPAGHRIMWTCPTPTDAAKSLCFRIPSRFSIQP